MAGRSHRVTLRTSLDFPTRNNPSVESVTTVHQKGSVP